MSPAMPGYAEERARAENLTNIEFHRARFLSYPYREEEFDGIASSLAFHHLPDAWKAAALWKMQRTLKPGGRLVLFDANLPS